VIEFNAERQLAISHQQVLITDLESRLRAVFDERADRTLFITAAQTLRYGDVVEVIDAAKGAGVQRVGIITAGMRRAAGIP
jgi:biopolymer transport protein ExbD